MAKIFGTFDEVTIGASLSLTQGDQILQTSANVNAHRLARSTFGLAAFSGNFEALLYSPNGSNPSLTSVAGVPPATIGVVLSTDTVSGFVGEGAGGYGYCPGDGKVYHNNAVLTTLPTSTYNDYIGVLVDPVAGVLTFFKNEQTLGSPITITTGQTWFYAGSVSGAPGAMAWWANSGSLPITFVIGSAGGWWQSTTTIAPILISTTPYITQHTDSLPDTKYSGDLDRLSQPLSCPRGVMPWPFGKSAPSQLTNSPASVQMLILDPFSVYSSLRTQDVRDLPVPLQRLPRGGSLDSAEPVFVGIIDRVEAPTDQTKLVYLTDKKALLQVPLTRAIFAPNADPSVAGKPKPMSLSVCRNYVPTLFDPINFLYAAHDSNLSALGVERNQGKPMVQGVDYNLTTDASGFDLTSAIPGKFTVESTSLGTAYDPGMADELAGQGHFQTQTPDGNNQPSDWLCTPATNTHWQLNVNGVEEQSEYGVGKMIQSRTKVVPAGDTCVASITLKLIPPYGTGFGGTVVPGKMIVGMATGTTIVTGANVGLLTSLPIGTPFSVTFTNTGGVSRPFGIFFDAGNLAPGLGAFEIADVKFQILPSVAANVALSGLGLPGMLQGIMIDRGPLSGADVGLTAATAIQTATGYTYGRHLGPDDQPQVIDETRLIMNGVCGDIYQDRSGVVQPFMLIAPESVSPLSISGSLTVTDIDGYLTPYPDNAENLTTRLQGGRNYAPYSDGDFGATSLTDCPLAVRANLKQAYQWTAVAGVQLSPRYIYAQRVDPLPSLFDKLSDGQAEITRVNKLYVSPRNFYVGTFFSPIGRQFEIGQVWNVTYPGGTLTAGQQLIILFVNEHPSEETTELIFWGL